MRIFRPLGVGNNKGQEGFSFVELLVVVVIVSVLGGAVYAVFSQGLRLYQRACESSRDVDMEILLAKMQRDLDQAITFKDSPMVGRRDAMTVYTLARSRQKIGMESYSFWVPAKVTYTFDPEKEAVLRRQEPYPAVLSPPLERKRRPGRIVGAGIRDASMEYYHLSGDHKRFDWLYYWENDGLPKAVRISLKYDDDSKGGHLERILPVPAWPGGNPRLGEDV